MSYFTLLRPVAFAVIFANAPAVLLAQQVDITADLTSEDIVQIAESCIDITAARDFEAGSGSSIDWESRTPVRAELTGNQQSSFNVSVVVTDVGLASTGGCELTFRTSDLGADVYAAVLADRDPVANRSMQGFCHNGTFIDVGYWERGDDYISSLDINALLIFSNGPQLGANPCSG